MTGAAAAGAAVVTGAGRGLGREIARLLAGRGYPVHVTDLDADAAARVAAELGPPAVGAGLDVRDEEACRRTARSVVATSPLAVWVNNAGVLVTGPAWAQPEPIRRLMLEVNAVGTINGTLAALAPMRAAGRGHIVNVVSLAGLIAAPGEAVYSASKHAALAFTLATLADLRRRGEQRVQLSCLCPDGIWTPMLADTLADPDAVASYTGTMLSPARVAAEVGWLLDHPRPVRSLPRHRGALVRSLDAWPRLAIRGLPAAVAVGRRRQRRIAARVATGRWPPGR